MVHVVEILNVCIYTEESGKIYANRKLGPSGKLRTKWEPAVSLIHGNTDFFSKQQIHINFALDYYYSFHKTSCY